MHQIALAGFGHRRHGKSPCNMDRGPQPWDFAKEPLNRRFVGKIDSAEEPYLVMLFVRKCSRLGFVPPRHVADRTSLNESPHHRGSKRPGSTRHDDFATRVIHSMTPSYMERNSFPRY